MRQLMVITVELPSDFDQQPDPARTALEAVALAGYCSGELTGFQAARLLGMGRFQFEAFLKARGISEHAYNEDDLEQDLRSLRNLEAS